MDEKKARSDQLDFKYDPEEIIYEIKFILAQLVDDARCQFVEKVYRDIQKLFNGEFEGYRASNTNYHDLEHTVSVALAVCRLIHGAHVEGHDFSPGNIVLAVVSALFHDTGLIQTEEDVVGSGAKYTIGHEERSAAFMRRYLSGEGFSGDDQDTCSHFIQCTILNLSPKEIPFTSEEAETLGKIVGSADLLAQMADRVYIEKLLLLYLEFEEAHLPEFDSEVGLLKNTEDFYENVAKKRLFEELGGVSAFMRVHFRDRWEIDSDLYDESILKNIQYLKSLNETCQDSIECYLDNLKRGGIAEKFNEELKK